MKSNILKSLGAVAMAALMLTGCSDDKFTSRGDLFQPRFALNPAVDVTNNNDAMCVWYNVNDAVGYTVQIFYDQYYTNLYTEFETKEAYFKLIDLPYGTNLFVRVRCNAADPANNSQWAKCNFLTEPRPEFAQILNGIAHADIQDNSVNLRWMVDTDNPCDSFSVKPAMTDELPEITGYIPAEAREKGEMLVEGLTASTLYNVNLYDTSKPRKYDKPYNQVTFRTTGPAPQTIEVSVTDDLSALLSQGNNDPDIPEGTVYSLPAGSAYVISPFAVKKGFVLSGPADGDRPIITMNGTWSTASGAYISIFGFENIELRNQLINQYFFNTGNSYTIEQVNFFNVKFVDIKRGFWRHQNANKKVIKELTIDNCWFDLCGFNGTAGGSYGFFNMGSAGKNAVGDFDEVNQMTIRNTTLSRCWDHADNVGWPNLIAHSSSYIPVNLTIENVTIWDFCLNNRLIDLSATEKSNVTIRGLLLASGSGEIIALGSGAKTNFSNNYYTTDYKLGGSAIKATSLGVPGSQLFRDPENGDYTIVDTSSAAYLNGAGDPRWIVK